MFKGLGYSLKQALQQIFRNKGMAIASLFAITAMLLILGLFFFLTVNVNFITEEIKDQFDTIEVFLQDDQTEAQADVIRTSLSKLPGVESVEYIDKARAMEEFKVRWGDNAYLLDGLSTNPLPNSLRVTLTDLNEGDVVAEVSRNMTGVEDVRYYQTEVNKILKVSEGIQKGALVVIAFLIIVSVVVVSNTVKLTVMARQEEIRIMKYVGATNWFIRGPLILEGMFIGLIASLIALGCTWAIYARLMNAFGQQAMILLSSSLVETQFMMINLTWIYVALGISIGAFGSILSMRRFLQA
ncbi:MAG: permease-like cell division protein FtsX [Firmicutes bacterium]|nr:permease-like cell division protein FtsX [Bacillota bacterium]MBR2099110.1 permease-like cell division protein FtsX [Bacillota bacterium]MBR3035428.1 permease-like cell division protein FtsX [Bacillota bacterium]MBR3749372.1 permease-like cell division protein FtsX [Bacillota bacterium]MCR4724291.1 permease-like cell division protein FtsX [Clostridia bacterium]